MLVQGALRRPVAVLALVIAILLGASLSVTKTSQDIFPDLSLPVVYVIQPYGGMTPSDMEGQLVGFYEYNFLYLNGLARMESKSIQGMGFLKLFFHESVNIGQAMAQVTALAARSLANMPQGTRPPFILRFDSGSIPVAQLVFSSRTRNEAEIQDLALFKVRPLLATLPGVSAPPPSGGRVRMVVAYLDIDRMRAYRLSPDQIAQKIARGNLTLPAGNVRIGKQTLIAAPNARVAKISDLRDIPLLVKDGTTVTVKDVARVEDGADIVYNIALVNGRRTVYMPVTKQAAASTLDVIRAVRAALPTMRAQIPDDVSIDIEFDQSLYVQNAVRGLAIEGALGALLTALVVLLFVRNWRSAAIVITTIPLSILSALVALKAADQTINVMTLGGLAVAVGILVNQTVIAIENIHTHLALGKRGGQAVFDAMREVMGPLLMAMLCIVAVFVPIFFMEGMNRALFVPLALAVAFSMVASYFLTATLVPVLGARLYGARDRHLDVAPRKQDAERRPSSLAGAYERLAKKLVDKKWLALGLYLLVCAPTVFIVPRLASELFPSVDTGQLQLKIRAPVGTRLEVTEELVRGIDRAIRQTLGEGAVRMTLANIGSPPWSYPVNAIYTFNSGPHEAVLLIALTPQAIKGTSTQALREQLRHVLAKRFPDVRLSFEAGDVVSQVLNFGALAPLHVTVSGGDTEQRRRYAERLRDALAKLPELRDVQLPQALDYPTLAIKIDRARVGELGLSVQVVVKSLLNATSSSVLTTQIFWTDPKSGTPYRVAVRVPESVLKSHEDLLNIPVMTRTGRRTLLRDVATVAQTVTPGEIDRLNGQRTLHVTANVAGNDLGSAAKAVERALAGLGKPPRGMEIKLHGQAALMRSTLESLAFGFVLAAVLVLLMLAANFQSFRQSVVVLATAPAVISGVVIALWLSGTTLNVQSMMGAIMCIGVSVANAVLLVSAAADARTRAGADRESAAITAARSRLRPIVMTSIAMITGMIPTALAMAEGSEQSAPLGRAVIGGLIVSTLVTLFFLPPIYALVTRKRFASSSLHPGDETPPEAPAADDGAARSTGLGSV
ncbi:MAG: efflux RND transporter permease subunit [Myxococcales bacterium]|nr:efflux RND transporter permease subunit [Myxococcales bacterium]